MALFGLKKEENKEEAVEAKTNEKPKAKAGSKVSLSTDRDLASVIIRPRVTEKAVMGSEKRVYTFMVRRDANKHQIHDAVKAIYKVTPVKVNIVNKQPATRVKGMRGNSVKQPGMKKAYVYLKEGDTINLV